MPKAITPTSTSGTGESRPKVKKSSQRQPSDESDDSSTNNDIVFKQSTATAVATSDDIFGHIRFDVRIPRSRLPMLIGTQGSTKGRIESETGCKLIIDSQEGDVTVEGTDVVKGYIVRDIVKAVGRGFNPDVALQLLKSDNAFELIEIADFVKNKNAMDRIKGRVIGQGGKTRETIEKLMDVNISVQGKTIGIIGEIGRVATARQGVEMLLEGSQHAHVYKWLEGKRRTFTTTELTGGPDFAIKDEYKKYLKD